jgi:L-cysteine S-thiosulfotransferase
MKHTLAIMACFGILQGCVPAPDSAMGFRLPDGNSEQGQQAFDDLKCHDCHSVRGLDAPAQARETVKVVLGRDVGRVQTYGELVTSIINPSHKLAPGYKREEVTVEGESRMARAYLNEAMTVQQLIDLVAFLQPLYKVRPPQYDPYIYAYPSMARGEMRQGEPLR